MIRDYKLSKACFKHFSTLDKQHTNKTSCTRRETFAGMDRLSERKRKKKRH